MTEIISVRFRSGGKEYYFDPRGTKVKMGDQVIIETSKGPEFGTCCRGNSLVPDDKVVQPLRPMLRLATDQDRETLEHNRQREKEAFKVCEAKIGEYGLEMELVRCECTFDGNKLLFFFTSEGRVDFRALVKDLASTLHSRIELRQIGVRDESKLIGGLGICGRPYCCNAFLEQFQPVSIKMAKTQGLSLNPAKISGACGRLMCCLKYEQDAYEDAVKRLPKNESFVETPDGAGNVSSVDFLRETVTVKLEDAPESPQTYAGEEIRVVRSGKGRRPEGYVAPPQSELEQLRKVTPRLVKQEKPSFGSPEPAYSRNDPKPVREQKPRQVPGTRQAPARQEKPRDQRPQQESGQGGGQHRNRRKHSNRRGKGRPSGGEQG
ncbi:MAG: hypothetical protein J6J87_01180 [Oscillospiraceae bacterium]|nr:hypothetical protein [Oscillospiraceae bacterium]